MRIKMNGDLIFNEDKWIYDWLEWESTCPNDIRNALKECPADEELIVEVNSGGGYVSTGQEIYSLLQQKKNTVAEIQSLAGSAAGVAAMGANTVRMSPVSMIMVHNVRGGTAGDYHEMEKEAETLKNMNESMSQAYATKSGKPVDEILELMDKETWLTANQCIEMGFADSIITESAPMINSFGLQLTDEIKNKVIAEKKAKEEKEANKSELLKDLDQYGV